MSVDPRLEIAAIDSALSEGSLTRRRLRERAGMGADRLNRLIARMHAEGTVTYSTDDSEAELVERVTCDADQ